MKIKFTHRKLCEDLAQTKGTNFFEVPLGSVWLGNGASETQIADVILVRPSYTRFLVDIYECKVTRADFLKEIRSGKWKGYLNHCHRFYFALLSGIATADEIPEGVGLIIRSDKGWHTVKAPKKRQVEIPRNTMLSMIFKKQSQGNFERRYQILRDVNSYYFDDGLKKILNPKVRKALKFYDKYEYLAKRIEKGEIL